MRQRIDYSAASLSVSPARVDEVIGRWQWRLGIMDWYANREAISVFQVVDEDGCPGRELVGVVIDWPFFTIVHTRELTEHDIIHELLHVAFPGWSHAEVERWTEILSIDDGGVLAGHARDVAPDSRAQARRRTLATNTEIHAFNLRTRTRCTVKDPEVVTMKNGRKAVRGVASDDGKTRVFRILSQDEVKRLEGGA